MVPTLGCGGCGARMNYEKTISLKATEVHQISLDSPLIDKGTVTIRSPGAPVNVHVVLDVNREAALKSIDDGKPPKDLLAGSDKIEDKSLEIGPGKKPFTVILWGARRNCEVTVKVEGK
jgi:hypothetical protein